MTITIERVDWADEAGTELRRAQRAELDARYGSDDHEPGTPPSVDDIAVFLVARDEAGTPIGCGGLRLLGEGRAEIKRMFVAPQARGAGVAVAVLRALEAEAGSLGVVEMLLETGTAQPDAMRFYEREGYAPIAVFGPYVDEPLSRCYARRLD
ncbi:GNAT family N-acetyltransferase [Plantibacter sp. LMC-P-059a]|uniref:GNAT family N-acetyltransferase n=1 Tax=Plantibacter sp. LMC-P-059a TaxID=3040297 RepID=UPI002549CA6D|nr:GNAT family N-acetyltransferase [Plantibacter sp. LMC-P-059a]